MMQFERDKKFTTFRISFLIVLLCAIFTVVYLVKSYITIVEASLLLLFTIIPVLIVIFKMAHSVHQIGGKIVIKNILNICIKQIGITQIKSKKINYKNVLYNGLGIMKVLGLIESKYEKFIIIKLSSEQTKTYKINGQILTSNGLQKLKDVLK